MHTSTHHLTMHGKADVSPLQCWPVVNPVACHCNHLSTLAQVRVDDSVDQDELVLGAGASDDTQAWPNPIQLLLAHLKERETVVNGG